MLSFHTDTNTQKTLFVYLQTCVPRYSFEQFVFCTFCGQLGRFLYHKRLQGLVLSVYTTMRNSSRKRQIHGNWELGKEKVTKRTESNKKAYKQKVVHLRELKMQARKKCQKWNRLWLLQCEDGGHGFGVIYREVLPSSFSFSSTSSSRGIYTSILGLGYCATHPILPLSKWRL